MPSAQSYSRYILVTLLFLLYVAHQDSHLVNFHEHLSCCTQQAQGMLSLKGKALLAVDKGIVVRVLRGTILICPNILLYGKQLWDAVEAKLYSY